ncbi:Alpha/Beta hydrolase protein [Trichoderma austrokoningii]
MKSTLAFLSWLAFAHSSAVPQKYLTTVDLSTVDLEYQIHRAISFDEVYKTYNFTIIPFAEPPLGIQDGSVGKICPQATPGWQAMSTLFTTAFAYHQLPFNVTQANETLSKLPPPPQDGRITEDCLVLDVLVPQKAFDGRTSSKNGAKSTKGAPVLVWIFVSGGFVFGDKTMFGSPNDLVAATHAKGSDGAIWVAMNYRLGAFGFLSGPTLQQNGTSNAELLDQRLALEWVQENIHLFGGDPDNVTIMGISAGSGSIMHHVTAYGGQKPAFFRRAIPRSAGYIPLYAYVTTLNDARNLPSSTLQAVNMKQIGDAPYGTFVFGPAVDGSLVTGMPTKLLLQGAFVKGIEVLSSFNKNEGMTFTDPSAPDSGPLLKKQIETTFPLLVSEDVDFIFDTLYPQIYDGSQPYTDSLGRAQLLIGEAALIRNENAIVRAAIQQNLSAFGYEYSVWPAAHGADQVPLFSNGPTPGVDPQVSSILKSIVAGFVNNGSPNKSPNGITAPAYGRDSSILNILVNASSVIYDPTANKRCDWWQKAPYY